MGCLLQSRPAGPEQFRFRHALTAFPFVSNEGNKKGTISRPFSVSGLLLDNRLSGALGSACAALQALAGVDLIVGVAHIDRFGRALRCAGTAGQALVGDNKSHNDTSVCILAYSARFIVAQLSQKSITKQKIRKYFLLRFWQYFFRIP
jgi:hypothetical protein